MKKLSLYVFLGLMFCNVGFAEDIYLSCKDGTSFIINDKTKKIIMNGVEREVVEWRKEFITFHEGKISKKIFEISGDLPILDRITGNYSKNNPCAVVKGIIF